MTELCGTFDAAKADWSKLFGEAPKSIDDIDVIGLHDKTIDKKREFVALDRVLEIIDTSQTYKMFAGEEDTYIDKRELREAVEALMEDRA